MTTQFPRLASGYCIVFFLFTLGCGLIGCASDACAATGTISFTLPAGGEVFFPNKTYTIRLATKGSFQSINLELSRDGGQTFSAIGTIDGTAKDKNARSTFVFKPDAPVSADCVLRATGTGKTSATATSMPFSIGNAASVGAPAGSITGEMLAANTITAANIANGSVVTNGLADGSVTTQKLADSAVTNAKIADLAVSSKKVSSGSASNKQVLTADGSGNADWADASTLGLSASGAAGGDLNGTYPNPSIASSAGNNVLGAINNAATTLKVSPGVLPVAGAPYVLKSGDTMSGALTLNADPTSNLHAATKQYVDAADTASNIAIAAETTRATAAENSKLNLSGGTLTGTLILPATSAQGNALATSINAASGSLSSSSLTGALPALDGSALTVVNAVKLQGRSVASTTPLAGQVLTYNGISSQWEPASDTDSNGTVTSITAGTGISTGGGPITASGTISIDSTVVPQLGAANTFTTGQTVQTGGTSNVGATIKAAAGQNANLLDFVTSTGAPLTHFDKTGDFSGNAATATTAGSAVTSASFSGTLSGDVSGSQSATVVDTVGTVSAANVASGANAANTATNLNTANTIVKRDNSGDFVAGTITATLSGNASTATTAGNVTGTVLINHGGTGQTTPSAAFNALAPTTSKGDIIVNNGGSNNRLPVGADGSFLVADSLQPNGVKWTTITGTVTGVTASAPLTSSGGANPNIALGSAALPTKPDSFADVIFGTSAITQKGLVVQGLASQAAHLQEWQDSTGAVLSAIDNAGVFTGKSANVTGTVLVANGGTGQTSPSAAFDALAPTTTTGDLIVRAGATNTRLPVGADGKVLMADSASASGVRWASVAGTGTVTSVATGTGLIGGAITTAGTLQIDPAIVPQLGTSNNFNVDGAASAPAMSLSGNWFSGGDSMTTKPHLLVEANGATSTGWNTSGTALGINAAAAFTGNLIDVQANGVSKFSVDANGAVTAGSFSGPLTGNVTGTATNVTGTVGIGNGGTGASTSKDGFNALSPLNTKGDILAHDGTYHMRIPVGTNGQVLTADSSSAGGVKWATATGGGGGASALAVATTSGTTSVNVSGVSVLVLNPGANGTFNLTLTGLSAGQFLVIENSSGKTVNLGSNVSFGSGQSQGVYANDAATLHVVGSATFFTP